MLDRIFPARIDNNYTGHPLAIWLLTPVVLLKLFMGINVAGLNPLVDKRDIIQTADAIPLESYGPEAANLIVFLFSSWGLGLFVLSLLGVIVVIRYRAMIPLMYLLIGTEQLGRKALSMATPLEKSTESGELSAGFVINLVFSAILVVGFILSLMGRRRSKIID